MTADSHAPTATVFKSRWGYHPCSYEVYLKIKEIKKRYFMALHGLANWWRWKRKAPRNRVRRIWIRDEQRRKIGFSIAGPLEEPKLDSVFVTRQKKTAPKWGAFTRRPFGGCEWISGGEVYEEVSISDRGIPALFERCKPVDYECAVLTETALIEIERLYEICVREQV